MNYNLDPLNDKQLKEHLQSFLDVVIEKSGDNLKAIVLYGGVAKADYTPGKSNVNLLFILKDIDLDVLDKLSLTFQKGISDFRLSPFMLTSSEIIPSSDVFAVKLFDIQQHHFLLYGTDFLSTLKFNSQHLKFISEQELSNQLSRMKYFYIRNFNLPEQLLIKVKSGFTTLLINANTLFFLKNKTYYHTRKEIIEHLLNEQGMDQDDLKELLSIKEDAAILDQEKIRSAYDKLMVQYKQLIKSFRQIQVQ
jgi:hypothetical protein